MRLRLALGCVILAVAALATPWMARWGDAAENGPGAGPFLRIETGDHEADINGLAMLDERTIVTVSDDKTARIWSADTLAPIGVIRPPVGPADEGALYAVATIGDRIAVGGRTGTPGRFTIQFYARPTADAPARPLGNLSGLPQPVTVLRYAPGGGVLAAGMQDGGGVRLFDMKAAHEIPGDPQYGGSVRGMDFDPQGRLAAVGEDGRLRLYGPDGKRLTALALPAGAHPWGTAFSPDGRLIAVGDRQAPVVYLVDAASMRLVRSLGGENGRAGSFISVAFSPDGSRVVAAGSYHDADGLRYARSWTVDGRSAVDAALARDLVTAFALLPDGMAFTTAEPSLGRTDTTGAISVVRRAHHIDLRDAGLSSFRLSPDGSQVELPANRDDGRHIIFDVPGRVLELREGGADFSAPSDRGSGIVLSNWRNSHAPLLNGRPVTLETAENVRSVAVSPTGEGAALGTDFFVRFVAVNGTELWHRVADATVWAINVSADGTRVVAGMGDGTVHWYSATTGEEIAALFIEPSNGHWALWTPEGFFDHDHADTSGDGRSLIGYAMNTGDGRAADYVQIGQLYPSFFRPDMVGLSFRNTEQARADVAEQRQRIGDVRSVLAEGLPSIVRILDYCGRDGGARSSGCPASRALDHPGAAGGKAAVLETSAAQVLVDYKVVAPRGGKLGSVLVARNAAVITPATLTTEEDDAARSQEATIPLGMGLNVIRITPLNASGRVEGSADRATELRVTRTVAASPAALPVQQGGASPGDRQTGGGAVAGGGQVAPAQGSGQAPAATSAKPKVTLYVLSVGVTHFKRKDLDLDNAVNDAQAVAKLFNAPSPPVFDASVVKLLTDDAATAAGITGALVDIAKAAGPDDLVLLFFAGHGQQVDGKYYYAPVDFGTKDDTLYERALSGAQGSDHWLDELFRREGYGQEQMLPAVQAIQAARLAVVLDTCYSASIATQDAVLRHDVNSTVTNALGHASGRFVLSSASARALDSAGGPQLPQDGQGHGLFTSFMLRALQGDADSRKRGRINVYDLATYTKDHVMDATKSLSEVQEPAYYFAGNDFFDLRAVRGTN